MKRILDVAYMTPATPPRKQERADEAETRCARPMSKAAREFSADSLRLCGYH
jgi:hypothetical protein